MLREIMLRYAFGEILDCHLKSYLFSIFSYLFSNLFQIKICLRRDIGFSKVHVMYFIVGGYIIVELRRGFLAGLNPKDHFRTSNFPLRTSASGLPLPVDRLPTLDLPLPAGRLPTLPIIYQVTDGGNSPDLNDMPGEQQGASENIRRSWDVQKPVWEILPSF